MIQSKTTLNVEEDRVRHSTGFSTEIQENTWCTEGMVCEKYFS